MKFDEVVTSFGFKENVVNQYICLKISGTKLTILYVDDILLASNNVEILRETKHILFETFEMRDLDEAFLYWV